MYNRNKREGEREREGEGEGGGGREGGGMKGEEKKDCRL